MVNRNAVARPPAGNRIRKTIVGLLFHPFYQTLIFVLQDGGDIHAADAQTGEIVIERITTVPNNSSWAIDEANMRVFICGDMGKAALFDIAMGARTFKGDASKLVSLPKDQKTWELIKPWYTAHDIQRSMAQYVNTVKFSRSAGLFVTGCSNGEVRLWSAIDCKPLGMLNARHWVDGKVADNIKRWYD